MAEAKLLDRLNKIKAIFENEGSTDGEKKAARYLFYKIMNDNGIQETDLDKSKEKKEICEFSYNDRYECMLLKNIYSKVIDNPTIEWWDVNPFTGHKSKNKLWFEITAQQRIDLEKLYKFYRKELSVLLENTTRAFLSKNYIFASQILNRNEPGRELSQKEIESIWAIRKIMGGLDELPNILNKALESGE